MYIHARFAYYFIRMRKTLLFSVCILASAALSQSYAQRQMESLDRGLVAIKTSKGVYTSWRMPGDEYYGVTYNLYRDGSLIAENLQVSNFTDKQGTATATYTVEPVFANGTKGEASAPVNVWSNQYKEIRLQPVINAKTGRDVSRALTVGDAAVGDLDGDGEYEFIVKRQNTDWVVTNDSAYNYFEAYKMDGTRLWQVNLGPNMRDGNGSENACFCFDFDQDGKAEVIFRGADGTVLPDGKVLGNANVNYRSGFTGTQAFMEQGDEFVVMLDGATGSTLDFQKFDAYDNGYNNTTDNKSCPSGVYQPGTSAPGNNLARRSVAFWMAGNSKGDGGHRATKFYFGAPYLDGRHPSVYIGRGCYTNYHAATWDVVNKKLKLRWACAVDDWNSPYYGQGYHNFSIVDVDGDGCDEICHGNMVVNSDGKFLSSTRLGHGDAQHYGDLDPFRDGIEGFRCLEDNPGAVYVDAATSEVLFRWKRGSDCGRCMAGNFTNSFPGAQLWTVDGKLWSATTSRSANDVIGNSAPGVTMNARIYWDGDLLEETFDYASVSNYQGYEGRVYKYGQSSPIFETSGCLTINSTKGNPCVQADILGDWREEFVLPTADNKGIRIYTTVEETQWKNYSLMYDPQYRQAVYWQSSGYNQPPHVSYFLGNLEGYLLPPPPACTNGKEVLANTLGSDVNGKFAIACETSATTVSVDGTVSPSYLQVNSPADYTFQGGTISGATTILKQGKGVMTLDGGVYQQTGATELWYGTLVVNQKYTTSPIIMKRFSHLESANEVGEVSMEYGAVISPAGNGNIGTLKAAKIDMLGGAIIEFDVLNDGSAYDQLTVDSLIIGAANCIGATPVLRITRATSGTLAPGTYDLITINKGIRGNVSDLVIDGLKGLSTFVRQENGKIQLVVEDMRVATDVVYSGAGDWDLNKSESFLLDGQPVTFVSGDRVTIDASNGSVVINIAEDVQPALVTVIGDGNVTIKGDGKIGGTAKIVKNGAGRLWIQNVNEFTGGVDLLEGTINVGTYADAQNLGALGAYQNGKSKIFIESGAALYCTAAGILEANITVGDSAIIQNSGALTIGGSLKGTWLVKSGGGSISWNCDPQLKKASLNGGSWNVGYCSGKSCMADTMVLNNGTLAFTSGSLYQYCTNTWIIPEGKTVTIAPSNCVQYRNKLFGAGTMGWTWHNSTTPREYLEGNWSEFTGTINFTGQSTDHPVRLCNTYGLADGKIKLVNANTILTIGGDPDSKKEHGAVTGNYHIGELTGEGSLNKGYNENNAFYIGGLGTTFTFAGNINAPTHKVGEGRLTLTKNTGDGAIYLDEGEIRVNGGSWTSASSYTTASGTGLLAVGNGCLLQATGCAYNSRIDVKAGGVFRPGYLWTGKLHTRTINIEEGGRLEFRLNKLTASTPVNAITGHSTMYLKGTVSVSTIDGLEFHEGDSWTLWTSNAFNASYVPTLELPELHDSLMWDTSALLDKNGVLTVIANPDYSGIRTTLADSDPVSVVVFGLDGKPVKRFASTYRMAVADAFADDELHTGAYLIRIEGSVGVVTKKLIKQ